MTGPAGAARVVAVGGANFDIIGRPGAPALDGDSNPGRIRYSYGGVARNIAENLARLGLDVELVTALGDDPVGRMILDHCRGAGIGTGNVVTVPGGTASYMAVCDHEGDMATAINDMTAIRGVTPEVLNGMESVFSSAAAVVADANLGAGSLGWLAERGGSPALYVEAVSAAKVVRLGSILPGIHTLKLNRLEAEALTGLPLADREQIRSAGAVLTGDGVGRVFITLGAEAVYWNNGDDEGFFEPTPAEVVSTTGAGDAFLAGVVYADLAGGDIRAALECGDAMASLALGSESAVNPGVSRKSLEEMLT